MSSCANYYENNYLLNSITNLQAKQINSNKVSK